jgi:predicted RNase H-like nuclease
MWITGVEGCRAGWFVMLRELETGRISCCAVALLAEVWQLPERPEVVGVDMPIGLLDCAEEGGRECDRAARALLGLPRRKSVFSPPVRSALSSVTFLEACAANAASSQKGIRITKQCFGLLPKLLEVDRLMDADRQKFIREVATRAGRGDGGMPQARGGTRSRRGARSAERPRRWSSSFGLLCSRSSVP